MIFAAAWESTILTFIAEHMRSPTADWFFPLFTTLNDHGFFWIVPAVILLFFRRTRSAGAAMLLSLLLAHVLGNEIIKPLIRRVRPCDVLDLPLLLGKIGGWSFPSGHTITSFAAATALCRFHHGWGLAALAAAALMGFSRLYVVAHWPTDVLAGMILGIVCGLAGSYLCAWIEENVRGKRKSTK